MSIKNNKIKIFCLIIVLLVAILICRNLYRIRLFEDSNLIYISNGYGIFMLEEMNDIIEAEKFCEYFGNGDSNEMRQILETELDGDKSNDPEYELKILINLAALEINKGNMDRADKIFDQACRLIADNGYLSGGSMEVKLYNNQSVMGHRGRDEEKAIEYLSYATDLLPFSNKTLINMIVKCNLIELSYNFQGVSELELKKHLKKTERLLNDVKKIEDEVFVLTTQCYIAQCKIYIELKDYKAADRALKRIVLYTTEDDIIYKPIVIESQLLEAQIYANKGNYYSSNEILLSALENVKVSLGDEHILNTILFAHIGANYTSLGDMQRAIEYSLLALEGYAGASGRMPVWCNVGVAYTSLGEYQEAEKYLFLAYHAALEYYPVIAPEFLLRIHVLYDGSGDREKVNFGKWLKQKTKENLQNYEVENGKLSG